MDALDSILKIEERLVLKATQAHIPIGGTFELLPLCNMNCDMCFIRLDRAEMEKTGRLRSVDEWLEIASQMKEAGTLFVLLTGGEPFLYPGFMRLYKGLRKMGMIVTINTNGTLINEEIVKELAKDKPRRVNVTLYGASQETYQKLCHYPQGFDRTIKAIELLLKYHIDVKLNGTIVPANQNEIQQLQDIADHYGLYMKMDTYIYPGNRERERQFDENARLTATEAAKKSIEVKKREYSQEKYNQYKQHILNSCHQEGIKEDKCLSCRAGKSAFWITWYGQMTSCIFIKTVGLNVFEEGFDKSWKYLVEKMKNVHMPEGCLSCQKREVCQVCGASVYLETGGFEEKPLYMCEYTDEILNSLMGEKDEKD